MSSRERKRAERRKRKQRTTAAPASTNGTTEAAEEQAATDPDSPTDIAAEAAARGVSKSEIRNERAREELEPLEDGERPLVVTIGALLSAGIALVTIVAWLLGTEIDGERPNWFQVFAPAILFGVMAYGMWNRRYWAVLGFQAVMGILMVGSFLSLIAAVSVAGALTSVFILAAAGTFFWFTVKALARIQMPDKHLPR